MFIHRLYIYIHVYTHTHIYIVYVDLEKLNHVRNQYPDQKNRILRAW